VSDTVSITEPDSLIIHTYVVEPYCPKVNDGSITLDVEGGDPFEITEAESKYVYYWTDNGSTTNEYQDAGVGEYIVIVEDASECKDTVVIEVLPENERCFKIPTAFSPNGDGVNETWIIEGIGHYYDKVVVEIYDRWGELLYKNRGYTEFDAWDGNYKGKPLPVDSYHFIITLNDGELTLTGQVTILR
ncbi:MAG: gliding motility-associated C-terminal domain-containing protein, partial [Bacteroidota bacterium]